MAASFSKLLGSSRPGDELKDWRKPLPVFLDTAASISAGPKPWHTGSVLDHTARCMNEVAGDPLAVWLAFVHDAGKLTTPAILLPHHYGHEIRGEILAPVWAGQLGLDAAYAKWGKEAALMHMRAGRYAGLRPGKKKMLIELFPPDGLGRSFWKMVNADTKSDILSMVLHDWHSDAFANIQAASAERKR